MSNKHIISFLILHVILMLLLPTVVFATGISAKYISEIRMVEIYLDGRDVKPPFMLGNAKLEMECSATSGDNVIFGVDFPFTNLKPGYYRAVVQVPQECAKVVKFHNYTISLARGKADDWGESGKIRKNKPKGAASNLSQRFEKPRFHGYRVNWCKKIGGACGKLAADNYCAKLGFESAGNFEIEPDVGRYESTYSIEDKKLCKDKGCTGFAYITCK